jgi:hypothetical protein
MMEYEQDESPETDHLRNYFVDSLWGGLCDLVLRDATREGNGDALMAFWRIHMLQFWQNGHNKYLRNGFRMLAGDDNNHNNNN